MLPLIIILRPFSWIWGLVLKLRHRLYDLGIKKSSFGPLKTFVIGNLELGGTGKTPLTIYLLNLLGKEFNRGFLSRGYGRKSKGYIEIETDSTAEIVGDEPILIKQSCPDVKAAVCEDRLTGLERLEQSHSLDYVVLDDAFQHRRLQSDFNILVTTYTKPFWENHLVPEGTLRDVKQRAKAAHVIVISKCPEDLSEQQMTEYREKASWYSTSPVHFTTLEYGDLRSLQTGDILSTTPESIVLVSGIADDGPLFREIEDKYMIIKQVKFSDHHSYSMKDVMMLKEIYSSFAGQKPVVITTSKDAVKLRKPEFLIELKGIEVYELPVRVRFLTEGFDEMITAYARANKGNG